MSTQPQLDAPKASKNTRALAQNKHHLHTSIAPAIAAIAATTAVLAFLLTQTEIAVPETQSPFTLRILAAFTVSDQGIYFLVAAVVFLVVSVLKFIMKNPYSSLRPSTWKYIWWPVVLIDTIFDVAYVVTAYFAASYPVAWTALIALVGVMVAIDTGILPDEYYNRAHIVAFDIVEALVYAGLTLLFLNLVVLTH